MLLSQIRRIYDIFVATNMDQQDTLTFLTNTLRNIIREEILQSVSFPIPEESPEEWYASSDVPRFIVTLDGVKPIKCNLDGEVQTLNLRRGEALYMEPYGWTAPYWDSAHEFFSIVFNHSYTRFIYGRCNGDESKPPPRYWHTSKGIDPAGHHVLQALNQMPGFPDQRQAVPDLIRALLRLGLCEMEQFGAESGGKAYQSYRTICDYLNMHAHLPLNREAVAEEIGVSPSHISRLFQEQGNTSFSRFLLRLRMERAVSLLQDSERTIKEVGYYCGFRNDSYFIRTFKGYHGVSPGEWRIRKGKTA